MNRLKSAKQAVNMENQLRTFEDNQKRYLRMMEQPLILALKSPAPETALALLEHGADPNIVTSQSHQYMSYSWYSRFSAESALDIAVTQLEALRLFKGDVEALSQPKLPEGMDTYLSNFEEGSYQHWLVSKVIDRARTVHRSDLKQYEKNKDALLNNTSGLQEKKAAIEEAIKTMEKVKEALLAKGAKTFGELYPDYRDKIEPSNRASRHYGASNDKGKTEPWSYTFTFRNVNDVTEARKDAYFKL